MASLYQSLFFYSTLCSAHIFNLVKAKHLAQRCIELVASISDRENISCVFTKFIFISIHYAICYKVYVITKTVFWAISRDVFRQGEGLSAVWEAPYLLRKRKFGVLVIDVTEPTSLYVLVTVKFCHLRTAIPIFTIILRKRVLIIFQCAMKHLFFTDVLTSLT